MEFFKKCNVCGSTWHDRETFLSDPDLDIIGYQVDFDDVTSGYYIFNHLCGTTFAVQVCMFEYLYEGPKYKNILTGSEKCPEHCLNKDELSPCGAECKYAFAREIIQLIKK